MDLFDELPGSPTFSPATVDQVQDAPWADAFYGLFSPLYINTFRSHQKQLQGNATANYIRYLMQTGASSEPDALAFAKAPCLGWFYREAS